jgi:hypothetical protein
MNKLTVVLISMCVMFANVTLAEEESTVAFEVKHLKIKLSKDRTGIVQGVDVHKELCAECDFKTVKITAATEAYENGKQVDLLRARRRSGKSATVIFFPDTRKVQKITWVK